MLMRLWVILLAFGLVVTACSAGSTPTTVEVTSSEAPVTTTTPVGTSAASTTAIQMTATQADVTVPACDLLTTDEVQAAIGPLTQDPVYDDSVASIFTCSYEAGFNNMLLDVTVYPDEDMAKGAFQMGIDLGGNERIEGPGDEAMSTQPVGDIDVRSGRMELTIDLFTDKSLQEELAISKDLATKAVSRLP